MGEGGPWVIDDRSWGLWCTISKMSSHDLCLLAIPSHIASGLVCVNRKYNRNSGIFLLSLGYERYWSFWRDCNFHCYPLHPITHSPCGELAAMAVVSILSECVSESSSPSLWSLQVPVAPDNIFPETSWEAQKQTSHLGHLQMTDSSRCVR